MDRLAPDVSEKGEQHARPVGFAIHAAMQSSRLKDGQRQLAQSFLVATSRRLPEKLFPSELG